MRGADFADAELAITSLAVSGERRAGIGVGDRASIEI